MSQSYDQHIQRRTFLCKGGLLTAGAVLMRPSASLAQDPPANAVVEVSPLEDLMREHGLLARILLIYDEVCARLSHKREFPPEVVPTAAGIVRHFVEGYHEKLEEDYIFPRFEKAGKLVPLTQTLRTQHAAGRALTQWIMGHGTEAALRTPDARNVLADRLYRFSALYRPHKAREDTVLFPAFHGLVTPQEYDKLGDLFEAKETELFGPQGFEKNVETVAKLEETLGINDLARFTGKVPKGQPREGA